MLALAVVAASSHWVQGYITP